MKAAIIGCGYVGKAVAQRWRSQGFDLTVTTTSPEKVEELTAIAHRVSILKGSDTEALSQTLADRDLVLLCVGSRRASYAETYLGTARALARVLPTTPVQQLIYTSTYSVYGQHHGAWVTEATPAIPATENGQIIAQAEQTLLAAAIDRVCVLRLGGIYGPGRSLAKIYARAAGTTRPGNGAEASNWVHLDDIVGAIAWAQQQQLSGIYNLVQDDIPTVRELIERVCDRHGLAPVGWDETLPSDRPYNLRADNRKLKATGYAFVHPQFDLEAELGSGPGSGPD